MRIHLRCPLHASQYGGATTAPECWTLTCASTSDMRWRWSDLRPQLELEARREAQREADAQLREIDKLLSEFLTPEQRKQAFDLWKAGLYEQQRRRTG